MSLGLGGSGGFSRSGADRLDAQKDARYRATRVERQVTNRTFVPSSISGGNTHNAFRIWQMAYTPITKITIAMPNWYVGSATSGVETGGGSSMTCLLSVEYPAGTFTRITWGDGGQTSGVIADGDTGYAAMTLPFTIPAFARFRICGDCTWTGAGRAVSVSWSNACDRGNGDEYMVGAGADQTLNSTVLGSGLPNMFGPIAVIASSDRGAWAVIGDSIYAGVNDTVFDPSGGRGIVGRPLAKNGPHLNMGVPGDRATWYAANSTKRRAVMTAAGVTSCILGLGVNDIGNARTAANILADRATIRAFFSGLPVFDTTITMNTASGDVWKTASGQTIGNAGQNTERVSFNTTLRTTKVAGCSGVIDIAGPLETNTANERIAIQDGGVWLPGYVGTVDGIHPNSAGCQAVEPLVRGMLETQS